MHANEIFGGYYTEVTPVPIPNTEVKLCSAYDTWREAARESWSLPEPKRERRMRSLFVFVPELAQHYYECSEYII